MSLASYPDRCLRTRFVTMQAGPRLYTTKDLCSSCQGRETVSSATVTISSGRKTRKPSSKDGRLKISTLRRSLMSDSNRFPAMGDTRHVRFVVCPHLANIHDALHVRFEVDGCPSPRNCQTTGSDRPWRTHTEHLSRSLTLPGLGEEGRMSSQRHVRVFLASTLVHEYLLKTNVIV
jgi:hypothetical protein